MASYESIAWQELSANTNVINFTSIPQTYKDLKVIIAPMSTGASDYAINMQVNNDASASAYQTRSFYIYPTGLAAVALTQAWWDLYTGIGVHSRPTIMIVDLFRYADTSVWKTGQLQSGTKGTATNNNGYYTQSNMQFRSTAAITSLKINNPSQDFVAGTTVGLYGIQ